MSTEPPPPEDDPFRKQPPPSGGGGPYGTPPPGDAGGPTPPGGSGPYGGGPGGPYGGGSAGPYGGGPGGAGPGGPYGGGPQGAGDDPLAGMPPLAGSWRRTLARIIDMILVGIVVGLISWGVGTSEYHVDPDEMRFSKSFGQSVIAAVLYIVYDTFLIARNGQTLGKRWLRMRVANLSNGTNPSVGASLGRAAVLWLPFAFCCACVWTAICGGWSFFDRPYKQGLHDKSAKTVVVSTP
ncbi:RDD family protein [Streptomyces sp. NPDC050560]|uniref:RDD family protein n=1 Tax=Streptomyces sp. NPDC050560 TaxID=3365630 RepID=UPI0037A932B8